MNNYLTKIKYIFLMLLFSGILSPIIHAQEKDTIKKMQEIYYYGKEYYLEGKYKKALHEFEDILKLSPGHKEAIRMINKCKDDIAFSADLLDKALGYYNAGSFSNALKQLRKAHLKDNSNFEVRSLMAKILVEQGFEASIIGKHKQALSLLEKAQKLTPDDNIIQDMVKSNKAIIQELAENGSIDIYTFENETESSDKAASKSSNINNLVTVFEKYHTKNSEIFADYFTTQKKLQELLDSSEKEKKRLYALLEEKEASVRKREELVANLLLILKKYFIWVIAFIILLVLGFTLLLKKHLKFKQIGVEAQNKLQEKLTESITKLSNKTTDQLTEFEKKQKKLEIIKDELSGKNQLEHQVALNILEQFLSDVDYRIRLEAIEIMHIFAPGKAFHLLSNIIENEPGELKTAACDLLGEIQSNASIDLLLKLSETNNNEIKKTVLASLVKIFQSSNIEIELKNKIRHKIDEIYVNGNWVIE